MLRTLLLSTLLVFSATATATAADNGPIVVEGPAFDRETCERMWWQIVRMEKAIEAGCPSRVNGLRCIAYMQDLITIRNRLRSIYSESRCYLWVD